MDKNKKLLRQSIEKYQKTVALLEANIGEPMYSRKNDEYFVRNKKIPYGWIDCPLCREFIDIGGGTCGGCCISKDTGKSCCQGTPYRIYEELVLDSLKVGKFLIRAAKKELSYLEGLYSRLYK